MKKQLTIYFLIIWVSQLRAQQQQTINFGDFPKPVPSVSSLTTYTDVPISATTGVPDISFPLLQIPSNNNDVIKNLSVGLSYHPKNLAIDEAVSEVGYGWSIFSGGVISREIVEGVDEFYDDVNHPDYYENPFDDLYFINLPGLSYKFKINRVGNSFNVVPVSNSSPKMIKIEFTRDNNINATLILTSFTITDDDGAKYIFNDYSESITSNNFTFKSAFHLSQIKDANNIVLANFTYQKNTHYVNNDTSKPYKICKLTEINSLGFGSIGFDYTYTSYLEGTINDPYRINSIILKDDAAQQISKYAFEYTMDHYPSRRVLNKIIKYNKSNVAQEETIFEYFEDTTVTPVDYNEMEYKCDQNNIESFYSPVPATGSLRKVIMPTGGVVEYTFEPNEYYKDINLNPYIFNNQDYQYVSYISQLSFNYNWSSGSDQYTYTVPINLNNPSSNRTIIAVMTAESLQNDPSNPFIDPNPNPGGPHNLGTNYKINDNWGEECYMINDLDSKISVKKFILNSGNNTVKFTSAGQGIIKFYELVTLPPPYKKAKKEKHLGFRIANVKYFESANDTTPQKAISYNYDDFIDPMKSSGEKINNYSFQNSIYEYVVYKNVKVDNSEDGYTKYYYKTPNDFPTTTTTINGGTVISINYYNMTRSGILQKKEVYNKQNVLVAEDIFNNILDYLPYYYVLGGDKYARPSYLKKQEIITRIKNTNSSDFIQKKLFVEYNLKNFSPELIIETSSDGSIIEKTIAYPNHFTVGGSPYDKLFNANMITQPIFIEEKKDGKLTSSIRTKYDNANSLNPTSIIGTNPNDNSEETLVTYDSYDSKGNLQQYTTNIDPITGTGNPVTIIWGYNQTLPIAKVEGATLANIGMLANNIVSKSDLDTDASTENTLKSALNNFRTSTSLKNFMITTYTYDPLIGITSVTPPNGVTELYYYDDNNQLIMVKDVNGNIVKENKYHYKP